MPAPKPITIDGVTYRSFVEACRAFGHAAPKVRHRMNAEGMSLQQALAGKNRHTGAKLHPNYSCWNAMRSRCYSPGTASYSRYGAKGIVMCDRWRDDFWAFVADMGIRPSPTHTVDRQRGAKIYCKENCSWATKYEQTINRDVTTPIAGFPSFSDAARAAGIHIDTLRHRMLKRGMSYEDAIAIRPQPGKRIRKGEELLDRGKGVA